MTIEQMELRLEKWKRFVWFSLGASVTILLTAAADSWLVPHRPGTDQYTARLFVWILVQCAAVFPAALLTLGRDWRKMPISLRFNTIFGFLAASWIAMISFGWQLQFLMSLPGDVTLLILLVGVLLAGMFFYLRNKLETAPESMFP